jgi:GH25 family lysozyme M1 (1,4-beta-N-acetylmuramidase)
MLDLSNNNASGHNFKTAYEKGGQRRVYLKRVEGTAFVDRAYPGLRRSALAAGFRVGAYDFLHPLEATPKEAADFLLGKLTQPLKAGRDLRPALDCEEGTPSAKVGVWISQVALEIRRVLGFKPLIYGSGYWLESCSFRTAPGPLWLAAYGRNDGKEYPVGRLPAPWRALGAHQYTSEARVVGIRGLCDLSHVYVSSAVEVPRG